MCNVEVKRRVLLCPVLTKAGGSSSWGLTCYRRISVRLNYRPQYPPHTHTHTHTRKYTYSSTCNTHVLLSLLLRQCLDTSDCLLSELSESFRSRRVDDLTVGSSASPYEEEGALLRTRLARNQVGQYQRATRCISLLPWNRDRARRMEFGKISAEHRAGRKLGRRVAEGGVAACRACVRQGLEIKREARASSSSSSREEGQQRFLSRVYDPLPARFDKTDRAARMGIASRFLGRVLSEIGGTDCPQICSVITVAAMIKLGALERAEFSLVLPWRGTFTIALVVLAHVRTCTGSIT